VWFAVSQRQSENTFLWMDVIWLVPQSCFHVVNFNVVMKFKLISDSGQISSKLLFFHIQMTPKSMQNMSKTGIMGYQGNGARRFC